MNVFSDRPKFGSDLKQVHLEPTLSTDCKFLGSGQDPVLRGLGTATWSLAFSGLAVQVCVEFVLKNVFWAAQKDQNRCVTKTRWEQISRQLNISAHSRARQEQESAHPSGW